jgi:hypothetical protein
VRTPSAAASIVPGQLCTICVGTSKEDEPVVLGRLEDDVVENVDVAVENINDSENEVKVVVDSVTVVMGIVVVKVS